MLVQACFAQSVIEALDVRDFHWLAWTDELQLDAMFVRPCIERLADELWFLVDLSQIWPPSSPI